MFTITGDVAQPGNRQNLQTFEQNPTLRDLRVMLDIVCNRLGGYTAWPVCSYSPDSQDTY